MLRVSAFAESAAVTPAIESYGRSVTNICHYPRLHGMSSRRQAALPTTSATTQLTGPGPGPPASFTASARALTAVSEAGAESRRWWMRSSGTTATGRRSRGGTDHQGQRVGPLPAVAVLQLKLGPDGLPLYAASHGRGIDTIRVRDFDRPWQQRTQR
jgi:hypothetical protein